MPPLSTGARGDEASRLHASLQRTGFQLPASEVSRSFFGPATHRALRDFQTARKLNVTGVLDAATASGLEANASPPPLPAATTVPPAAASPVTSAAAPATPFVVRGQVTVSDGMLLTGVTVVVVDQDLRGQELLEPRGATTQTNQDGRYEVNYTSASSRVPKRAPPILWCRC